MKIAICAVDSKHPNLALMRISAWHKKQGDTVEWFTPLARYDRVYASKIFTFTPDDPYLPDDAIRGGTGYDVLSRLPDEVERCAPDYSIYPEETKAYGFLTRGCVNKCPWCVVPKKEGMIRAVADIEAVAQGRRDVVLMDNNFLAADEFFVRKQLLSIERGNYRVDFNQALDARRIPQYAHLLSRCKFIGRTIRMSCDTDAMIGPCVRAMDRLRMNGFKGDIRVYVLAKNDGIDSALDRIGALVMADARCYPFVMPFRNLQDNSDRPSQQLKRLARWCNRAWIRKSCDFEDYRR